MAKIAHLKYHIDHGETLQQTIPGAIVSILNTGLRGDFTIAVWHNDTRPPKKRGRPLKLVEEGACGRTVYWWGGEYEGECKRPQGHRGDHYDGSSWFDDDNEAVAGKAG